MSQADETTHVSLSEFRRTFTVRSPVDNSLLAYLYVDPLQVATQEFSVQWSDGSLSMKLSVEHTPEK